MVITKRKDVTKQGFCKILRRKRCLWRVFYWYLFSFFFGGGGEKEVRVGTGTCSYFSLSGRARGLGGGGCLFEAGRLLTFSPLGWALTRDWALIRKKLIR